MNTGSTLFYVKIDFGNVGIKRTVTQRSLKDICFNEHRGMKRKACQFSSFRMQISYFKGDKNGLKAPRNLA